MMLEVVILVEGLVTGLEHEGDLAMHFKKRFTLSRGKKGNQKKDGSQLRKDTQ